MLFSQLLVADTFVGLQDRINNCTRDLASLWSSPSALLDAFGLQCSRNLFGLHRLVDSKQFGDPNFDFVVYVHFLVLLCLILCIQPMLTA